MTGGGSRDIDVNVYGPDDKAVYNAQKQSDGKFTFAGQQKGIYRICFSNKMSSVSAKLVSFFTTVGEVTTGEFAKAGALWFACSFFVCFCVFFNCCCCFAAFRKLLLR